MNALAQILITVALVAVGVGGYHVLVAEDASAPAAGNLQMADRDLGELEARLGVLEDRSPVLVGGASEALADRLAALEKRIAAFETAETTTSAGIVEGEAPRPPVAWVPVELDDGSLSPLSEAQEKRIRDLVASASRDRRRDAMGGFMDRQLQRLGLELTDDQKQRLDASIDAHRTKIRDLFTTNREAGISREETMSQMQELTKQLTDDISSYMPAADAEAITSSFSNMGRRGPGGGGRGR